VAAGEENKMEAHPAEQSPSGSPKRRKIIGTALAAALTGLGVIANASSLVDLPLLGKLYVGLAVAVIWAIALVAVWPATGQRKMIAYAAIALVSLTAGGAIYVAARPNDTKLEVIKEIKDVCTAPEAVTQTGNRILVACAGGPSGGEVVMINAQTRRVVGKPIPIPGKPHDLIAAGRTVLTPTYEGDLVALQTDGSTPPPSIPGLLPAQNRGGDIVASGTFYIVNDWRGGRLIRVDLRDGTLKASPMPRVAENASAITAGGGFLWISDSAGRQIVQMTQDGTVVARIPLPASDSGKGADPEDAVFALGSLFVVDYANQRVLQVSPDPPNGVRELGTIGFAPSGIAFDGRWIWVSSADDDLATRIDPLTGASEQVVVGQKPVDITASNDIAWTANGNSNSVSVVGKKK
jgi:DNA-binding beta-propeller fold protein YncE